jgi:ATP-dependent RNA helicase DDX49/DBP8
MMTQARELEARPHIVVATPGRLCDLLRSDGMSGNKLGRVKVLVSFPNARSNRESDKTGAR